MTTISMIETDTTVAMMTAIMTTIPAAPLAIVLGMILPITEIRTEIPIPILLPLTVTRTEILIPILLPLEPSPGGTFYFRGTNSDFC
jgi:hypothetical protein